jgi:hypothetical protein
MSPLEKQQQCAAERLLFVDPTALIRLQLEHTRHQRTPRYRDRQEHISSLFDALPMALSLPEVELIGDCLHVVALTPPPYRTAARGVSELIERKFFDSSRPLMYYPSDVLKDGPTRRVINGLTDHADANGDLQSVRSSRAYAKYDTRFSHKLLKHIIG